ncbi:MAG: bifunctional UDP-N-acetylglucosamine diphosphorylase/glucosamine-1-phosphate N-acetyltransferase GlmU [Rhodospirillum sp.]|nr:bifunctional UDP-N-acetylglucosamine diphosphorylase/glucosamine-1-phosphate N-acetyltransferase GlmU [Rhodospirillum sp.]MCF8490901.1 bifunctional UDP-N-acetylglucosamine diphosphorylase/glucosamine-1-phosphate N-acetyltransferase GlmU [Rhodospirillum sp.]MCF8499921.1 bifunctional UDP-N-acetylglucosamine diphosphorylase/glucosamine-1-phosphate N-acetyltransferase GlmU [Rhodospirillum sp.]
MTKTAAVVLSAGMGTRMKSDLPKVLHPVAGRPMVAHVTATLAALEGGLERLVVVIGPDMEAVAKAVAPHPTAIQAKRLGTGHAVLQAREVLMDSAADTVLVVYGDTPLITGETLSRMIAARKGNEDPAVVVLGFRPADPSGYGRLVTGADGLDAIIEHKDATEAQRAIGLCNAGVMAIDAKRLFPLLERVGKDNAKGEYYLTDIIALARAEGRACVVVEGAEEEMLGVNSRLELAEAERICQDRLRREAMENGATLVAPETVFFSVDTVLGRDVTVGPFVTFGPGVTIGDRVEIKGFCHFEGATVGPGVTLGPYARLRPGADVQEGAHIGNFVEIKKATVEPGAKVNHLTYIGDARVGAKANIGAGTITCNYDGFGKYHTDIGAGAFIGSNTALVAPVTVGDGAIVGAGSTIVRDVPADALAITRADQTCREGWAVKFRQRMARVIVKK